MAIKQRARKWLCVCVCVVFSRNNKYEWTVRNQNITSVFQIIDWSTCACSLILHDASALIKYFYLPYKNNSCKSRSHKLSKRKRDNSNTLSFIHYDDTKYWTFCTRNFLEHLIKMFWGISFWRFGEILSATREASLYNIVTSFIPKTSLNKHFILMIWLKTEIFKRYHKYIRLIHLIRGAIDVDICTTKKVE